MFTTKYCPSGSKCKLIGEAGLRAFGWREVENCSLIHLILQKINKEQVAGILSGRIEWDKRSECNAYGTLELGGLSVEDHKKVCTTLTVGIDLFTCPACNYSCSNKDVLDEHQNHCEASSKRKSTEFINKLPAYEPSAKAPKPQKNWHLESATYVRPKMVHWYQMALMSKQRRANEQNAMLKMRVLQDLH